MTFSRRVLANNNTLIMNIRSDFPVFEKYPSLIYLDSAATAQRPNYVIDWIASYMRYSYSNIHRGAYELSSISEELYELSKKKVQENIWAKETSEIIYTYNSTYGINLLAQSLKKTWWLKKDDTILVNIAEHHANFVPWLMLKEEINIELNTIWYNQDSGFDYDIFTQSLSQNVRLIALTAASNTTGEKIDLLRIKNILDQTYISWVRPFLVIDASQLLPHEQINVELYNIDFLVFTGHKVMADTGIGVLYGKKEHLRKLIPAFSGWWAINYVSANDFSPAGLPYRFEPWTPHLVWAVSLLRAFEYIESIWWYEAIASHEKEITAYIFHKLHDFLPYKNGQISLIGSKNPDIRIGLFSFALKDIHPHDVADFLADNNIAVRSWHHCTEPLHMSLWIPASIRLSIACYTTKEDIDTFFLVLEKALITLS